MASLVMGLVVVLGSGAGEQRPAPACEQAAAVYVTDIEARQILRMAPDGSNAKVIVSGTEAHELDIDVAGRKLYWASDDKDIMRANLDGSSVEVLLRGMPGPYGLALDPVGRRVLWTNQMSAPRVQSAALSGTDVRGLVPGAADAAIGISVDRVNGFLYWMEGYYRGRVMRVRLAGGDPERVATTVGIATGVDVDPVGGKVYWTEYGNGPYDDVIRRANLDGSGVETLFDASDGLQTPQHIAVDPAAGKIYWTDLHAHRVQRGNLDGTGLETIWSSAGMPRGIALLRRTSCGEGETPAGVDAVAPPRRRCGDTPCVLELTDLSGNAGPRDSVLSLALDATGQPLMVSGDRVLVRRPSGEWAKGMADQLVSSLVDSKGGATYALGYPGVHLMKRQGDDFKEVADFTAELVRQSATPGDPRSAPDPSALRTWGPAFQDPRGCFHFFYAAGDFRGIAVRCGQTKVKKLETRPGYVAAVPLAVHRSGRWHLRLERGNLDGPPLDFTATLGPAGGEGYLYTEPTTRFSAAPAGEAWTELASWKGQADDGLHHHRVVLETTPAGGRPSARTVDDVQTTPGAVPVGSQDRMNQRSDKRECVAHKREINQPLAILGGPAPLLLHARTHFDERCQVYPSVKWTDCSCEFVDARGRLFVTLPDEGFRTVEVAGTKGFLLDIRGAHAVQDGDGNIHLAFGHYSNKYDEHAQSPSRTSGVARMTYLKIGLAGASDTGTRPVAPTQGTVQAPAREDESWPATTGRIEAAAVQGVVAQNMMSTQRCFERAALGQPGMHGRIVVQWTVSASGAVRRARIKRSTGGDEALHNCLVKVIQSWRFPRPDGGEATLEYPFLF